MGKHRPDVLERFRLPVRLTTAALAATLVLACDAETSSRVQGAHADPARATSLTPPPQLRMIDAANLSVVVEINGERFDVETPDDDGEWRVVHTVAPDTPVEISVEWRSAFPGFGDASVRLAVLETRRASVSDGAVIALDRLDYDTDFDSDGDGATNLEEVVFGSSPLEASDAPPRADMDGQLQRPTGPPPADVPGSPFDRSAVNSARLPAPMRADQTEPLPSSIRPIPFQVDETESGLQLLSATVYPRVPRLRDSVDVVMVLANRSSEVRCRVSFDGVSFGNGDSGSEEPRDEGRATLVGPIGQELGEDGPFVGETCIAPGAFGYVVTSGQPPETTDVVIESIASVAGNFVLHEAGVRPTAVSFSDGVGRFTAVNDAERSAMVNGAQLFFLDGEGVLLGVHDGSLSVTASSLAPSAVLEDEFLFGSGAGDETVQSAVEQRYVTIHAVVQYVWP